MSLQAYVLTFFFFFIFVQNISCKPHHTQSERRQRRCQAFTLQSIDSNIFFSFFSPVWVFVPLSVCVDTTPSAHRSRPSWRQWPKHTPGSNFPICLSLACVYCVIMQSSTYLCTHKCESRTLRCEKPVFYLKQQLGIGRTIAHHGNMCIWKHIYVLIWLSEPYIQYDLFFFNRYVFLKLKSEIVFETGTRTFSDFFYHSAVILQTRYRVATDESQAKMNVVEPEPGPLTSWANTRIHLTASRQKRAQQCGSVWQF